MRHGHLIHDLLSILVTTHESGAKKAERIKKSKPYKKYLKWHVASVLGLQVIAACRITLVRTPLD